MYRNRKLVFSELSNLPSEWIIVLPVVGTDVLKVLKQKNF